MRALSYVNKFKDNIRFLLIRRKHTLNYIEFLRGRYDLDDSETLIHLLELMSPHELSLIKNNSFETLWIDLWKRTSNLKIYEKEFNISKIKFDTLSNTNREINLKFLLENINPKFKEPEWGFPKGKRNFLEDNLKCATREFYEETDYNLHKYNICENLLPINEVFNGTNGVLYKHIYYLAIHKSDDVALINNNNQCQIDEIGDIGWFTYEEAKILIRPYYNEKRKLLDEIFILIINLILLIQDNMKGELSINLD